MSRFKKHEFLYPSCHALCELISSKFSHAWTWAWPCHLTEAYYVKMDFSNRFRGFKNINFDTHVAIFPNKLSFNIFPRPIKGVALAPKWRLFRTWQQVGFLYNASNYRKPLRNPVGNEMYTDLPTATVVYDHFYVKKNATSVKN